MAYSYQPKDSSVLGQTLKVQELNLPFYITHNATASAVTIAAKKPDLLFLNTAGVTQITVANGAVDNTAELNALTFSAPVDTTGLFSALIRINEPVTYVVSGSVMSRNDQGWAPGYLTALAAPGGLNLASSASYAVLGASAVTNTGNSVLTGNLGVSPGTAVTGFPPGTVSGVENIGNPAAVQAQSDALAAYTAGEAMTATPISSTLDGQTLTPGVYSESSGTFNLAGSGNATLTFNGAGTYIFKCSSTLTTGAGGIPTMTLTNGATANNIFWLVGSSATINSGYAGTFQGTIIAHTSITDTEGGTVNGNLMALNGAVTLSAASTITINPTSGGNSGTVTGISLDGNKIYMNFPSGGNFKTNDYDGCITVRYITQE